jgi:putative glutamine amidotransferase
MKSDDRSRAVPSLTIHPMRIVLTLDRDASRREENDYVRALLAAGVPRESIDIVAPGRLPEEAFDGLLLGGGCDVDPARYGRERRPEAGLTLDAHRDETDFAFLQRAVSDGVPVLGICRGIQVVNVALGGTLVQDLPSERPSKVVHQRSYREKARLDHTVSIAPGTRLSEIARAREIEVNSRHHQAIDRLAGGLVASATSPDGVVEAVEDRAGLITAVQWHPENLAADLVSRRLIAQFVLAVGERSSVEPAGRTN